MIRIEKLNLDDIIKFLKCIKMFEDVFEMQNFCMPSTIHLAELLKKEDFFVFVALDNDQVVGGLTSYILRQYYSEKTLIYIFDLAVKREYQRKGIGKKLIEANNAYSKSLNAEVVMVQADVADDHAIEFYRSTGAKGEDVIHFDYTL